MKKNKQNLNKNKNWDLQKIFKVDGAPKIC